MATTAIGALNLKPHGFRGPQGLTLPGLSGSTEAIFFVFFDKNGTVSNYFVCFFAPSSHLLRLLFLFYFPLWEWKFLNLRQKKVFSLFSLNFSTSRNENFVPFTKNIWKNLPSPNLWKKNLQKCFSTPIKVHSLRSKSKSFPPEQSHNEMLKLKYWWRREGLFLVFVLNKRYYLLLRTL